MMILLSPAKTLDMQRVIPVETRSEPALLAHSKKLLPTLKALSTADLRRIMSISETLATLNHARFAQMAFPAKTAPVAAAIAAFRGDVYEGLAVDGWAKEMFDYAQSHLRILSGLYGLLRPLDIMQAYRLEMGTKLANPRGEDLYDFWGTHITARLAADAAACKANCILNLASQEYSKSVNMKALRLPVISPVFKEHKDGKLMLISFYAKKARGTMARWLLAECLTDPAGLVRFTLDGYRYEPKGSTDTAPLFVRG